MRAVVVCPGYGLSVGGGVCRLLRHPLLLLLSFGSLLIALCVQLVQIRLIPMKLVSVVRVSLRWQFSFVRGLRGSLPMMGPL